MKIRHEAPSRHEQAPATLRKAFALGVVFCALAGCGQTGPLELPQDASGDAPDASGGAPQPDDEAAEAGRQRPR